MYFKINFNTREFNLESIIEDTKKEEYINIAKVDFEENNQKVVDYFLEIIKEGNDEFILNLLSDEKTIDGTKTRKKFFDIAKKFDVFLSHSHNDEDEALALAGYLKEKLGLSSFIDSHFWGYVDDLIEKLDMEFCLKENIFGYYFDYKKRNITTAHAHLMLSTALTEMIDSCDIFLFFNSKNSIKLLKDDIVSNKQNANTQSAWIYNEIVIASTMRKKSEINYREELSNEILNESSEVYNEINISYNIENKLDEFIELTPKDLKEIVSGYKNPKNKTNEMALNHIYNELIKMFQI